MAGNGWLVNKPVINWSDTSTPQSWFSQVQKLHHQLHLNAPFGNCKHESMSYEPRETWKHHQ